jgi:cell division protein FtsL
MDSDLPSVSNSVRIAMYMHRRLLIKMKSSFTLAMKHRKNDESIRLRMQKKPVPMTSRLQKMHRRALECHLIGANALRKVQRSRRGDAGFEGLGAGALQRW